MSHDTDRLVQNIKRDILKSGFPLELYVLNVCASRDMARSFHTPYWFDGKQKEIDLGASIWSTDECRLKGLQLSTSTLLIIECKKSGQKPWVFFSTPSASPRPPSDFAIRVFTKYASDLDSYFNIEEERSRSPLLAKIAPLCKQNHYADTNTPMSVAYVEAFRNPDKPSEIYAALDSTLSFMHYYLAGKQKRGNLKLALKSSRSRQEPISTQFVYPVIVLEGEMFHATANGDDFNIAPSNHVQLQIYWRFYGSDNLFLVDVVRKEYFKDLVAMVERDHEEFRGGIKAVLSTVDLLKLQEYKRHGEL